MSAPFSLRFKAVGLFSLLLLGIALVVAVAIVRHERFFLLEEGNKRVHSLALALAVSARDPLLVGDELRLGPITQSIMEDPDTVYAYVLDHLGLVAYHPDTQLIGSPPPRALETSSEKILRAVLPVAIEGTTLGTAIVGLSAEFADRATRKTIRGLLVRFGFGTFLGLAGVLALIEVHTRRIEKLEAAVASLATGNLSTRVAVSGRDEIARLARGFNLMVDELRAARSEVEQGITETVSALASTIEVNDAYTYGHCERVGRGTRVAAERLGVTGQDLRDFELAAILHDIGKIGVSSEILAKRSRLSKAESRAMQEHATLGARVLASVSFLNEVARYVRHHHEDWDGGGYPDGLAGESAPLASRIIHVVDAYDAMTSNRPYRAALPEEEAAHRLVTHRGRQFDPSVVDVFLELIEDGAMAAIRRDIDSRSTK